MKNRVDGRKGLLLSVKKKGQEGLELRRDTSAAKEKKISVKGGEDLVRKGFVAYQGELFARSCINNRGAKCPVTAC